MKEAARDYASQAGQLRPGFIVLIFCFLVLAFTNEAAAQQYTFPQIKEIFLRERPQTGDPALREACFGSIDDLIIDNYPPLHPGARELYTFMIRKVLREIKTEVVSEGATIWQIYNHGFVVKTPSVTFGIDLVDYFYLTETLEFPDLMDVYFISHDHEDHYNGAFIEMMKELGKPVVGPAEFSRATIKMAPGETRVISGLTVTAHDGLHSVPVRQFEIVTPEGLKFLHTGDNQTSETLPQVENIDVMMLNAWINESGTASWIEGVRNAVNKMKPVVTLPGHILELGHLPAGGAALPYMDVITADDGTLPSEYYVLGWGERYHYPDASNDSIPPNPVRNPRYAIDAGTITFSWDPPEQASDGDTASFYRVILNDSKDFITPDREFQYTDMTSDLSGIKLYSYDDCGNQSLSSTEMPDLDKIVKITFQVKVPDFTPLSDPVYMAGNLNDWDPGTGEAGVAGSERDLLLTAMGGNLWQIVLPFTSGDLIQYKYTRGSWENVEKGPLGEELPNRTVQVPGTGFIQTDTVVNWRDISTGIEGENTAMHGYELLQNY
ncbi:MAG: MBL fold metallo-hydrolase, partial [Calditrichia bacterium]